MNCNQCAQWLDDYVDGSLPIEPTRQIEQHLAECRSCAKEMAELQALLDAAKRLPREIDPVHNLWPGIERAIDVQPTPFRPRPIASPTSYDWLQWAAVIGLLLVGLATADLSMRRTGAKEQLPVAESIASAGAMFNEHADRARSEDGILLTKIDLVSTIEERRDRLDRETVQQIESDMLLLEQAIGEIRAALVDQPDNRKLRLALAARYQQEMRFLQQVSRV